MFAFLVLAAAPLLVVVPGVGPPVLMARRVVDRFATPAALAFLLASTALAVIGYMLQALIRDRLGVDVPYATLRWFLMLSDLGLWATLLAWSGALVGAASGAIAGLRIGPALPASLIYLIGAAVAWKAW